MKLSGRAWPGLFLLFLQKQLALIIQKCHTYVWIAEKDFQDYYKMPW